MDNFVDFSIKLNNMIKNMVAANFKFLGYALFWFFIVIMLFSWLIIFKEALADLHKTNEYNNNPFESKTVNDAGDTVAITRNEFKQFNKSSYIAAIIIISVIMNSIGMTILTITASNRDLFSQNDLITSTIIYWLAMILLISSIIAAIVLYIMAKKTNIDDSNKENKGLLE